MSTRAWGVVPVVEAEARQRKKEFRLIVPCLEGVAGWLVRRPLDVQDSSIWNLYTHLSVRHAYEGYVHVTSRKGFESETRTRHFPERESSISLTQQRSQLEFHGQGQLISEYATSIHYLCATAIRYLRARTSPFRIDQMLISLINAAVA